MQPASEVFVSANAPTRVGKPSVEHARDRMMIGPRYPFRVDGNRFGRTSVGAVLHRPDCDVEDPVERDTIAAQVVGMSCSGEQRENCPRDEFSYHTSPLILAYALLQRALLIRSCPAG